MGEEKIVVLGGGGPFTLGYIDSITRYKNIFDKSEVVLMDIDPPHLGTLTKLGEGMAKDAGVDLKLEATTDAKEALDGATFILPTFRVGGLEHFYYDVETPTKYGIYGDETAGPGGTFMAQCTIPAMLEYCRIIEDLCPDAWVVSYVNPTNFVADAVRRVTKVKFIGICDTSIDLKLWTLPSITGIPPERTTVRIAGINHNTLLMEYLIDGQDRYPLLREKARELKKKISSMQAGSADMRARIFALCLFEILGYFPTAPAHCMMYWAHDECMEEMVSLMLEYYKARDEGNEKRRGELELVARGDLPLDTLEDPRAFGGYMCDLPIHIMASIAGNLGHEIIVNVPNDGSITNLPQGSIVEIPAIIDAAGAHPLCMGKLPKCILGLTLHLIQWQELTVDAALSGDKNLLFQALLACPYVHSKRNAEKVFNDLLKAHAPYMPQFKK